MCRTSDVEISGIGGEANGAVPLLDVLAPSWANRAAAYAMLKGR